MNTTEKTRAVINTLEKVSVAGPENWNKMLGCWQTLQEIEKELVEHETNEAAVRERDQEDAANSI